MTRAQLHAFHVRRYTPERMVVAVAGNVDHHHVVALARRYFGARLHRGRTAAPPRKGSSRVSGRPTLTLGTRDAEQAHMTLGVRAPGRHWKSRWALSVLNTALGVRSIPQDYLNVARVLQLSPAKTFFKVLLPAALPYMFTGFRLSLGIAWLVIVAVEMLTGSPGIGGFLWQEYNSLIYEHIILCILTIGIVGFVLDRMMSVVEHRLKAV